MWIEPVVRGSRVQLYEYFKPGLTQIVLATGKPTCPRLVPFNLLFCLIPFRIRISSSYGLVFPFPFPHPFVARVFLVAASSSFSHLSRRSTPLSLSLSLSLSSASLTLSPSFRVAYPSLSPPASRLPVSSPLFSVALERLRSIDSFPGNMKERVRRTWFIDFCFSERGAPWNAVSERMGYRKRYRLSEWNNYRGRNYPATLPD